MILNGLVDKAK